MDHEDILKACDKHLRKAQDEMTLSRKKRKRSSSQLDRESEKRKKKKKREKRYGEGPSKTNVDGSSGKKNPLEMLELEMRARAIKAFLLKADQQEAEKEKKMSEMVAVTIKEEPDDDDVVIIEKSPLCTKVKDVSGSLSNSVVGGSSSFLSEEVSNTSHEAVQSHQQETNHLEELPGDVLDASCVEDEDEEEVLPNTALDLESNRERDPDPGREKILEEEDDVPQRVWTKRFDKELPKAITSMCLGGMCRLCKVDFNSDAECEEHYLNDKHFKRVGEKLEVLFADRPGEPIGWRQNLAPRLLPKLKDDVRPGGSKETSLVCSMKEEEDVKERRPYHREWTQMYDRAMPESILNLCLENECKLCKASLKHEVMAKQHFEGKAHAKNVNLELEEIYKATGIL